MSPFLPRAAGRRYILDFPFLIAFTIEKGQTGIRKMFNTI
jgi:hypothetical protein